MKCLYSISSGAYGLAGFYVNMFSVFLVKSFLE
jgi:hypothetical protein